MWLRRAGKLLLWALAGLLFAGCGSSAHLSPDDVTELESQRELFYALVDVVDEAGGRLIVYRGDEHETVCGIGPDRRYYLGPRLTIVAQEHFSRDEAWREVELVTGGTLTELDDLDWVRSLDVSHMAGDADARLQASLSMLGGRIPMVEIEWRTDCTHRPEPGDAALDVGGWYAPAARFQVNRAVSIPQG